MTVFRFEELIKLLRSAEADRDEWKSLAERTEAERDEMRLQRDLGHEKLNILAAELAESQRTWRCFHCGFETSDRHQALGHFGEYEEGGKAICVWAERECDDPIRALQDADAARLEAEREMLAACNERDSLASKVGDEQRYRRSLLARVSIAASHGLPAVIRELDTIEAETRYD